jgi:magnesium-transporting ATPase (P-type)
MEKWYGDSWNNIVKDLKTNDLTGLNSYDIEARKIEYGKNIIKLESEKKYIFKRIIKAIDIHSILQITIAILLFGSGYILQGLAIILAALLFGAFELYKYKRKMNKMKQLETLNMGTIRALRDGRTSRISIEDLVVGDIVILEEGETVPADLRIMDSEKLQVKESSVTGKDETVEKYEARIYGDIFNLWEIKNILFKSAEIIKGRCTAVVIAVGFETQIGKLVAESNVHEDEYELVKSVENVMRKFKHIALILILVSVAISYGLNKDTIITLKNSEVLLYALYLNIAILAGVLFTIFVKKSFKQKGVDYFDVFSIQNIAKITTLMINDKGFLCEDEITIKAIFTDGVRISEFNREMFKEYNIERMLQIAYLCNNARRNVSLGKDGVIGYIGDNVEIALLKFAESAYMNESDIGGFNPRVFQIPMDSERKIMTTINKVEDKFRANVKGDSEEILRRCTHIMKNGVEVEITQGDIDRIKGSIIEMSNNILKVVGLAYRNFSYEPSISENIESNLVFVGLFGMENSVREDSISNLEVCKRMGIKTVLATENNKLYAHSLSKRLKVSRNMEEVLSGIELKYMSIEEQERAIDKIKVFSNIFQENKARLIKFLNGQSETTAICTNQFSDLPALSEAKVGIAYGEDCSNTIKRISDIFMKDNSFYNIIFLIKSCRVNIIKINISLAYLMSIILCELLLISLKLLAFPDLNVDFKFISVINLLCIPLNIIYILIYSKYEDRIIESYFGKRLTIKVDRDIIIKSCVIILFILSFGIYLVNKYNNISITLVSFIVFTIAQFIVKRTFQKVEIEK